jgi:outer membrane lipopolysaccharide assembly protein LptE/RlpB
MVAMDSKDSIEITEKVDTSRDVVTVDETARKAERKLRTKIDFFVVPTVTLLYLMCFIDRTNIGKSFFSTTRACLG